MAIETLTKPKAPAGAKPFLFDRNFDRSSSRKVAEAQAAEAKAKQAAVEISAPEPEPPPAPTFSEEDLAAARAAAFEEGRQAGLAEAHAEREEETVRMMAMLAGELGQVFHFRDADNAALEAACLDLVERSFAKLMPVLAQQHGAEEIRAVLANALEMMLSAAAITLRLSPQRAEDLAERLEETARMAGYEGRLRILPDPSCGPSDIAVDWGDGRADRRLGQALDTLNSAIAGARARAEALAGPRALLAPGSDDEEEA